MTSGRLWPYPSGIFLGKFVHLGLVVAGSVAAIAVPPQVKPDAAKIYPYVVPDGYFGAQDDKARSLAQPLGHGLQVALVYDLNGMVRNVLPEELPGFGLTVEQAGKKALENLVFRGEVQQQMVADPNQKPFIIFNGHWAAATCILLPGLREMAVKNLGSEEIWVSIPHREALVLFAKGDRAYRDSMRKIINHQGTRGRWTKTAHARAFRADSPRHRGTQGMTRSLPSRVSCPRHLHFRQ
jgi:hypothetical protein